MYLNERYILWNEWSSYKLIPSVLQFLSLWDFHQCQFMNQIKKKTDLVTLLSHFIYTMQKQYALVIEI